MGTEGLISFSKDADSWEVLEAITENDFKAVGFGKNKYIIVGEDEEIMMSPNGKEWEKIFISNESSSDDLLNVAYIGNNYVAIGESYLTYMSPNGESWTKMKIIDDRDISWYETTSNIFKARTYNSYRNKTLS